MQISKGFLFSIIPPLNRSQCMDLLSAGTNKLAVVERWPLVSRGSTVFPFTLKCLPG